MSRIAVIALALASMTMGCAVDSRDEDPIGLAPDATDAPQPEQEPSDVIDDACSDGDERECSVDLPSVNGVANCFHGYQDCIEGVWTPCGE